MLEQTTITLQTDSETKRQAQELFDVLGVPLSVAINVFLKQAVREQRIPFEITNETPNSLTERVLQESEEGRNLSCTYDSIDELMASLHC